MARQLIPRVTPEMVKNFPDQFSAIINQLIDAVNELQQ